MNKKEKNEKTIEKNIKTIEKNIKMNKTPKKQ